MLILSEMRYCPIGSVTVNCVDGSFRELKQRFYCVHEKQDSNVRAYNVKLRGVRATIVVVEKQ